jgi:primosomal protein N' (replication factor Y) (superfamily II helicase)
LRVVRVLPDQPAIDKTFDYSVPEALADQVGVGTMVRIALHGRRVGGWVVADGVEPPPGVTLHPLAKVTGWGPAADVLELAEWAAWRWSGRPAQFLRTASPEHAVRNGPRRSDPAPLVPGSAIHLAPDDLVTEAFGYERAVLRLPPAADTYDIALAAAARGNALILVPSVAGARYLGLRLRRAGLRAAVMPRDWAQAATGGTVVGARAAAWAPVRELAAVVVLDEHDEGWQQEQAPTWHARDVVAERARRAGVPCVLVSPTPSLEALAWGRLVVPSRSVERDGWPMVDVVDRRDEDPGRAGLFSDRLVTALRSGDRVLCVLNRKGRARLLACTACGEIGSCERCEASVVLDDEGAFACRRCDAVRPPVCLACGRVGFKNLRAGVTRVREELEALAQTGVVEVTGATTGDALPEARIYVGTEAVLHQVAAADVVAFLDFDQELLAPRYRAAEEALALLARAARIVGGRRAGGRLLIQTRLPGHEVVQAAVLADPTKVSQAEAERRTLLRFPPVAAMAAVSGAGAPAFMAGLQATIGSESAIGAGVEVLGPSEGTWLVRAPEHAALLDLLRATPRPAARLRIAVDPLRL